MAILYALLRGMAAVLRLVASAAHARSQARYERLNAAFLAQENDCKAHEVDVGRPVDYAAQLRLLKAYETKETARKRWVGAARRLERAGRREEWLTTLSGRKLPYTFGLIDMALVLNTLDRLGYGLRWEQLLSQVWPS